MADRDDFNKSVTAIATEKEMEMGKFIARLKKLTPDEFLRLPRRDLERLSMTQYAEVAAVICPGLDLRPPHDDPEPTPEPKRRTWSTHQRSMAAVAASAIIAAGLALVGPLVVALNDDTELVRPHYIGDWPRCARLTDHVDGCVYIPRQNLQWDYVAYMLGQNIADLRDLNLHLPTTHAPAREKIIVWRGIGHLEN